MWSAIFAVIAVGTGVASCGESHSGSDRTGLAGAGGGAAPVGGGGTTGLSDAGLDGGASPKAASYVLSGYLIGLAGGAVVLGNGGDLLTLSADGAFTFPGRLPDGASYAVTVEANPPVELCTVANASGAIASADVVSVAVTCLSTDATLASLSISPGTLTPGFAPGVTSYTASTFHTYEEAITVRAVPTVPGALLQIGDSQVSPGVPVELSVAAGAQTIDVTVTAPSGAMLTYTVAVTRSAAVYFKSSNSERLDDFGWALSISGDTFVASADGEASSATGVNGDQSNNDAPYSGAVYVFTGAGQSWRQQAYLKASNSTTMEEFGEAVALDGDTLVAGGPGDSSSAIGVDGDQTDVSAPGAGAAYVFDRTGEVWTQTAYLKASNTEAGDNFGSAVALSGDTLVVGAPLESSRGADPADNSASGAGAVYVFERQAGVWTETAYLKASNAEAGDGFGGVVALDGDMLVVGVPDEASSARGVGGDQSNNDAPYSGAAYVFQRTAGVWTQTGYLKASNSTVNTGFGSAVAVSGGTIVVSGPGDTSGATGVNGDQFTPGMGAFGTVTSGAAYVFVPQGATFVQQAYLKPFGTGATFNSAVGISGDAVVVGGNNESCLFTRRAGVWSEKGLHDN